MAKLKIENKGVFQNLDDIQAELMPLKVELSFWPIQNDAATTALLSQNVLTDENQKNLLEKFDDRFEQQKKAYGYQTRDLVVLHPETSGLEDKLKIFDKCHRHSDDEVRYIIDGSGIFGFIMPNGLQAMLTIEAGEYIRVPANTEHWFVLDQNRRIKAIRYFTSKEGWVANYTGTEVRVQS